jgi:hypothetical protein
VSLSKQIYFLVWYAMAVGILWLPPAALLVTAFSFLKSRLRQRAGTIWWVSLGATTGGFWAMTPSIFAVCYETDWTLLFHGAIGVWPAGIIQSAFGIVTGACAGRLFARAMARATRRSRLGGSLLQVVASAIALFICYIPVAAFEDSLGGGSGYGEGVPGVFMWIVLNFYTPVFYRMKAANLSLHFLGEYSPVALWISGAVIVLAWSARRIRKTFRPASQSRAGLF